MISVVDVAIQAANPSMPLYPWRAFMNSPSSLRIRNVPKRVGDWNINRVYVQANYPDNTTKNFDCKLTGGLWVGTVEGSSASGSSMNGYTIFADGKDENGNYVTGYVLGKGDIQILEADGTITPGETTYYVHMLSGAPEQPKEGDLWPLSSGGYVIYQNGQVNSLGLTEDDLSAYATKNDLEDYAAEVMENYATKTIEETTETSYYLPDGWSDYHNITYYTNEGTEGNKAKWKNVNTGNERVSYDVVTHELVLTLSNGRNLNLGRYTPEELRQYADEDHAIDYVDEETGIRYEFMPSKSAMWFDFYNTVTKEVVYAEGGYDAIEKMLGDIETILNSL